MSVLLLLPLFAAGAALSARADVHIVDPWPDPASVHGVRIENVTFPSSSPFTPGAVLRGHSPPTRAIGTLYLPPHAAPDHATPAVVLLHGAAGMVAERGAIYGPQLAAMGIAALVVDTFGARRDLATTFIGRVLNITETMFVADAYAALAYLAARPEIDAQRVVLAGFSWGGMAATYALYAQLADLLAPPGLRFAGHVAFYAPCIARFADSRTTGAPLLMLNGGRDELIRPDRCAEIAADLRAGGSAVTTIVYPEAVHQWDGGLPRMLIGRNLSGCRFRVERDGTVRDARTLLPMNGPFLRKIILGLCVPNRPYPIGRDDAVRAQSNRDFGAFLARVFARPRSEPQSAG
ncbi:MAG: dienelactone hydrolase family protein [Alphaproteobacteria bacterium]|nr:dienelactone hydrolase family protein [Alphaproteobacteria bacterium]